MRTARTALQRSLQALDEIPAEIAKCEQQGDFAAKLSFRIKDAKGGMSTATEQYEPKYAFGKFEPGRWSPILSEEAAIRKQKAQLEEIADRLKRADED